MSRSGVKAVAASMLLATALLTASAAGASEAPPPGMRSSIAESDKTRGGVTYTEATATVEPSSSDGGITPYLVGTSGSTKAEAKLVTAGNGSQLWLSYAHTKRLAGTGSYNTAVHAALNEYSNKSQWQSDPSNTSWDWGYYSATCASVSKTSATSTTCASPKRSAGNRYYWAASGHTFSKTGWTWSPTLDIYRTCSSGVCTAG